MRRKDREITELSGIIGIINSCDCCRLGLADGNEVYIVPMNFGYDVIDEHIVLYFHSAGEGRKISLLSQKTMVSFEMDTKHELVSGNIGCEFSYLYQCVMGTGNIEILHGKDEKTTGLKKIMEHYTGRGQWEFDEKVLDRTVVMRLLVKSLSCKEH